MVFKKKRDEKIYFSPHAEGKKYSCGCGAREKKMSQLQGLPP